MFAVDNRMEALLKDRILRGKYLSLRLHMRQPLIERIQHIFCIHQTPYQHRKADGALCGHTVRRPKFQILFQTYHRKINRNQMLNVRCGYGICLIQSDAFPISLAQILRTKLNICMRL